MISSADDKDMLFGAHAYRLQILLIDDDQDDYVIVRMLLAKVDGVQYDLKWVSTYDAALDAMASNQYDVCLVDYRLGIHDGLELLQEAIKRGCKAPIILLTGRGGREVDIEAMKAGAADYLVKGQLDASLLERSIRYAIERTQTREHLRSLASKLVLTEERERKQIATELHDHIGQVLAVIKMRLRRLHKSLEASDVCVTLEEIQSLVEQTIKDTRSLTFELSPPILYDVGFEPAVEWLGEQFQRQHGVHVTVEDDKQPKPMDDEVRVLLFRSVRELLFNVIKHAQASQARVVLRREEDVIEIVVEDDGVGFHTGKLTSYGTGQAGFGLFKNRERLGHLGGSFEIKSEPGHGTRVRLTAPLKIDGPSQNS